MSSQIVDERQKCWASYWSNWYLHDNKYSFDVDRKVLNITVLRSLIYAHHDPFVPNKHEHHSFINQGVQHFAYTLLPHTDG